MSSAPYHREMHGEVRKTNLHLPPVKTLCSPSFCSRGFVHLLHFLCATRHCSKHWKQKREIRYPHKVPYTLCAKSIKEQSLALDFAKERRDMSDSVPCAGHQALGILPAELSAYGETETQTDALNRGRHAWHGVSSLRCWEAEAKNKDTHTKPACKRNEARSCR